VAPSGEVDQYVNVGHELGVVTGYCQGPGHSFEQNCPDWVDETL
jgi:hypothetical protein